MSLQHHHFATVINSSDVDIAQSFLEPALSSSIRYDRGVGFFSAGWLGMIVEGMTKFAENGGRARIITSPILSTSDWQALKIGSEARNDEILRESLREIVGDLRNSLSRDVYTALSWLIADEILTFKLAIPINKLSGEFHSKFGIFTDLEGNQISFEGSNNETINGTVHNYESFKIFSSWKDHFKSIVEEDANRFERLWNNEDANLRVYNLPEATRQAIIRIREETNVRPYSLPNQLHTHDIEKISLWKHQEDAIDAWQNNNRIGLLSMATGSGKTKTALVAAERCPELSLLIIAVPKRNLVTQWADEVNKHTHFPAPILVFESSLQWQDKLFNRILTGHRQNWASPLVIIGTMDSLSNERFQSVIYDAKIPERTLLIVDEAHNVGAPKYQRVLTDEYKWRLGLSATPIRHFDDIGTAIIQAYFDKTVFVYSMQDAMRDGYLTPYEYYVYPAELTEDEYEEYIRLTQRIVMLRSRSDELNTHKDNDNDVEKLLIKRARILKKTASKIDAIEEIIQDFKLTRALIYCADQAQLEDIQEVVKRARIPHTIYIGSTPQKERDSALEALARGDIPILLAIDCLDEGVDVPAVREAIIVASSTNKRQFIQRRGRVLRKAPNKKHSILIDVIALPPPFAGQEGKLLLNNELARAREMAELAENRYDALLSVQKYTDRFGVMLTELLSGEDDE